MRNQERWLAALGDRCVSASNAKEARAKFDELWDKDAHPFNIKVRKLRDAEEFLYHWFYKLKV